RLAGGDVAEGAGPGADRPEDHESGVLLLPAFAQIRAGRFLADGMQLEGAHQAARLGRLLRGRRLDPDPVRLAQHGRIRTMRLFRMAQMRRNGMDVDGHDGNPLAGLTPEVAPLTLQESPASGTRPKGPNFRYSGPSRRRPGPIRA